MFLCRLETAEGRYTLGLLMALGPREQEVAGSRGREAIIISGIPGDFRGPCWPKGNSSTCAGLGGRHDITLTLGGVSRSSDCSTLRSLPVAFRALVRTLKLLVAALCAEAL